MKRNTLIAETICPDTHSQHNRVELQQSFSSTRQTHKRRGMKTVLHLSGFSSCWFLTETCRTEARIRRHAQLRCPLQHCFVFTIERTVSSMILPRKNMTLFCTSDSRVNCKPTWDLSFFTLQGCRPPPPSLSLVPSLSLSVSVSVSLSPPLSLSPLSQNGGWPTEVWLTARQHMCASGV